MPRTDKAAAKGNEASVQVTGVRFRWPGVRPFEISVDSLTIGRGERVLLLGPSGSGKSTLLNLVCGISRPQAGKISILGRDFSAMSVTARDRFRAEHYGIIFQMFNLLPYASALDNVLLPLSFAPKRRRRVLDVQPADAEATRILSALGIGGALATHGTAANLSVGQQQRVAAARALIGAPEIIVADEPTSALDENAQDTFVNLLFDQVEKVGATLLMVSHDRRLAQHFDRAVELQQVAVISTGESA
ncbi:MAG: ABC transporter ATP-binding protein [Hyphomicrobiales bacterium]